MAYSQNDPRWKNDKIGYDTGPTDTIGNYGCYMTAIANVCTWAGNELNPQQINDLCKQNNWLVSSDLIGRDDVPAQLCSNLQFVGKTTWHDATSMNFFDDASDPNIAYIICIDASKAPGIQTHFVMVWKTYHNGDLEIDDSWDGVRKPLSHYGNPSVIIQSATKFVKVAPPPPAPVVVAEPIPESVPAPVVIPSYVPPAPPVTAPLARKYKVITTLMYFRTSQEAAFKQNALGTLSPKTYYRFADDGKMIQLGDDNQHPKYWINSRDNVVIAPEEVAVSSSPLAASTLLNDVTPAEDWKASYKPFVDGKSRKYTVLRDMYIIDLSGTDKNGGIEVEAGTKLPIFGWLSKGGMVYLIPFLNGPDGKPLKDRYYGIPTDDIYSGLPNMESEAYRISLTRMESENRIYRKSVGHETMEDKLYYAQQLFARAVKDGLRVLNGIVTMKQLRALTKGQKENK